MSYLDKLKADDELAMKVRDAGIMGSGESEVEIAVWMLAHGWMLPAFEPRYDPVLTMDNLLDSLVTQAQARAVKE